MQNSIITLIVISFIVGCSNGPDDRLVDVTVDKNLNKLIQSLEEVKIHPKTRIENLKTEENLNLNNFRNKNSLFLYISDIQCTDLIEQEFQLLKTKPNIKNVMLLCYYKSSRNLKILLLNNEVDIQTHRVNDRFPPLILKLSNPTYFKLDENLRLKNVFIPKLGYKEESHKYLISELIQRPNENELNVD